MFEWYDCDLRYCTFCCNGKCLNKKREECPYVVKQLDNPFLRKDFNVPVKGPRTDEEE